MGVPVDTKEHCLDFSFSTSSTGFSLSLLVPWKRGSRGRKKENWARDFYDLLLPQMSSWFSYQLLLLLLLLFFLYLHLVVVVSLSSLGRVSSSCRLIISSSFFLWPSSQAAGHLNWRNSRKKEGQRWENFFDEQVDAFLLLPWVWNLKMSVYFWYTVLFWEALSYKK